MVKLLAQTAPAKINLFLRVTGRRPDGYHELDSIFLPLALCDRVVIEIRSASAPSITLHCEHPGVPPDDRNLAFRAAAAFASEFATQGQIAIDLRKAIPPGAGLGGGSSDAATTLLMVAAMTRIHQPQRLRAIALSLGADVPFFLDPRPARVSGIGEQIAVLPAMPSLNLVIAVPPVEVPTARVFAALDRSGWSGPAPEEVIRALSEGEVSGLVNDLEPVAMRLFPEIAYLKHSLEGAGARAVAMSGSGGAVFGVFPDAGTAGRVASELARRIPDSRVFATTTMAAS